MVQLTRWVAYGLILMALPIVAWRLFQVGASDPPQMERPEKAAATERAELSSARASGLSVTGSLPETSEASGALRTKRRTSTAVPTSDQVIVDNLTAADLAVLKQDYSCDLALTARQECNLAYEDADAYETCLSLRQYYSYSRHCGYQP